MKDRVGIDKPKSRRSFLGGAAAAGTALAIGFPAPAILAQTRSPIRVGLLNTFSGVIAYSGTHNWNAHEPLFRQGRLEDRRPSGRVHQGGRPVQSADRPAEGEEAPRKRQGRPDRRTAGLERRHGGAELRQGDQFLLSRFGRRHFRHHLGAACPTCSAPRCRAGSSAARSPTGATTNWPRRWCWPPSDYAGGRDVTRRVSRRLCEAGRQGHQGDLSAARHQRFQPIPHRHQIDQPAGDL